MLALRELMDCSRCCLANYKYADLCRTFRAAGRCSLFRYSWPWVLRVSPRRQRPRPCGRGVEHHHDRLRALAVYFGRLVACGRWWGRGVQDRQLVCWTADGRWPPVQNAGIHHQPLPVAASYVESSGGVKRILGPNPGDQPPRRQERQGNGPFREESRRFPNAS